MKLPLSVSLLALFALTALFPGCAYFTREFTEEQEKQEQRYDDAGVTTEITSALLSEDAAKANDVNVHCFNGHVFLIGEADKPFRQKALDVSRRAEGVAHVTTHWFPPGTALSGKDMAIESEIAAGLPLADAVNARRAAVDIWGGHVVLTGFAGTQGQIDAAVTHIKRIKQVKSVTSYLSLD